MTTDRVDQWKASRAIVEYQKRSQILIAVTIRQKSRLVICLQVNRSGPVKILLAAALFPVIVLGREIQPFDRLDRRILLCDQREVGPLRTARQGVLELAEGEGTATFSTSSKQDQAGYVYLGISERSEDRIEGRLVRAINRERVFGIAASSPSWKSSQAGQAKLRLLVAAAPSKER